MIATRPSSWTLGVDAVLMVEAGVDEVVGRRVRAEVLRHQATEPGSQREPDLHELAGDDAGADAHVGVADVGIDEHEIRGLAVEQQPRPLHDRAQHLLHVPDRGEVTGRLEERRQFPLPAPALVEFGTDQQRAAQVLAQVRESVLVTLGGRGCAVDGLVQILDRGVRAEHPQQRAWRGDPRRCVRARHARRHRAPLSSERNACTRRASSRVDAPSPSPATSSSSGRSSARRYLTVL